MTDLKFALRSLIRAKGLTLTIVLTLYMSKTFMGNAVLVPPSFAGLPAYWRRAVLTHEAIHLKRRHGYAIVMECTLETWWAP